MAAAAGKKRPTVGGGEKKEQEASTVTDAEIRETEGHGERELFFSKRGRKIKRGDKQNSSRGNNLLIHK